MTFADCETFIGRNYPATGRNNPEEIRALLYLKSKGYGNIVQY
jgi:hypothetical protein